MAAVHPITRQISSSLQDSEQASHDICISELKNCFIIDRHGDKKSFSSLFEHNKAIIIFVRVRDYYVLFVYVGHVCGCHTRDHMKNTIVIYSQYCRLVLLNHACKTYFATYKILLQHFVK